MLGGTGRRSLAKEMANLRPKVEGGKKAGRNEYGLSQANFLGVKFEKPPIGDDVRAANVEGLADRLVLLQAADKVVEDITDADRLDLGFQYLSRD